MSNQPTLSQDLDSLAFAERFVLWAARLWARGYRTHEPVRPQLEKAFSLCHAPDGIEALDDLLLCLAAGALRSIEINCPCCREVSGDEVAMLGWLADLQRGEATAVEAELAALLRPSVVPAARRHVGHLSRSLSKAGLDLASRGMERPPISAPGNHRTLH